MQKKKKKRAQLPFRLNILFFTVFLLFSILIIQLGVVQILNGEAYQDEIDRTDQETIKTPSPRGKIYDRYHNVIVDNKPLYSITYTPQKGVQAEDNLDLAEKLSALMTMADEDGNLPKLTERNKKEYWYLKNTEEAISRLTDEEKSELDNTEQYDEALKRITEEEIEALTDEELEVIAIKRELDRASALAPQIIKNEHISAEEYAQVAEHLDDLKGINATIDWTRERPYGETFGAFIGSITEGILSEQEDYYVTRGYSRNDRVGRSGLEQQYEEVLRGKKEEIEYTTDSQGNVIDSKVLVAGERGNDLVLTTDMEYQERVDELVRDELEKAIKKHPYENRFLEDALVVVMQPKTGEILAVSGQHYNRKKDEYHSLPLKALHDVHEPGSSIKGATMLAGYQSGVIQPNEVINDKPMKIKGTEVKKSVVSYGFGPVNDLMALERSSNVYMFHIALRMGGEFNYQWNKAVNISSEAFQDMRNYFGQFGLGVKTGIDFPNESSGYIGESPDNGKLLDLAIGQFDTYTTLQLAQYVSTIANDGVRVRPHLLKEVRLPTTNSDELGAVSRSVNTSVLNQIEMDMSYIERVQEGFYRAYHGAHGTASSTFKDKSYNPAGKTGTAETHTTEDSKIINLINQALVGYAPFEEPEVAFAVIVPSLGTVSDQHPASQAIGEGVLDIYFDLKEERQKAEKEADEEDRSDNDTE